MVELATKSLCACLGTIAPYIRTIAQYSMGLWRESRRRVGSGGDWSLDAGKSLRVLCGIFCVIKTWEESINYGVF